ncbi:interleukin-17A-like [Dendropsophus ebraccatus]|uniref:interleukin-17A-like n=1 Tax=Dendropsophus ebraccatus TaxID=150705 RepID=UPI0038322751
MAAHWETSMVLSIWLLLGLSSCVHGTGEQIPGADGWDVPPVFGGDCLFPPDTTFPSHVKVDMKVSSSAQLVTDGVRSRSMSPWEYSSNVDHNRLPVVINEARCLHHGCMDSEGNVDLSMNSVPIRQEILVLHREMRGCLPVYKMEKQMVTVGCTCVRPITHYLK